jgi:hypothetical protein
MTIIVNVPVSFVPGEYSLNETQMPLFIGDEKINAGLRWQVAKNG